MPFTSSARGTFGPQGKTILVSFLDGSTSAKAAPSAVYLKNNGINTSGIYWINLPTVGPQQVFCDMSTFGGGWMFAMKIDSTLGTGTVRHYFEPAWWNNQTPYSAAPANPRTNGELKTAVYGYYPHSQIMLEYGYGSSYFQNIARARYTQPGSGNATNQNDVTMSSKMSLYHEGGGRTFNGFTTQQYRWTKAESSDNTFFPNAYMHISFGSHANSGTASNDFFRIWFNNVSDLSTDSPSCNQVGGFGMSGDFVPGTSSPQTESQVYTAGNASGTISPPEVSNVTTCQWNGIRAFAGTSGEEFSGSGITPIGSQYYNNGIGLIWVR